jgi:hypothetical protein
MTSINPTPYWTLHQCADDRLLFAKSVFKKREFFLEIDGYPADGFVEAHFKVIGQFPVGYVCANHFLAEITKKTVQTEFWYQWDWDKSGIISTITNKVETVAALLQITEAVFWCIEMDHKYLKQPRLKQILELDTPTSWNIGDVSIQIILNH